ncbi:MAG: sulfotransferase family 2 domain-containing protein, partial [Chloroflexaceae bacterium]|nr:sulfotransferase family 2 domain-containing protein [Chloroflexaceae bacterium]
SWLLILPRSIIFLHIPKAAGTTLRYIIQYQAPPQGIYELYGPASGHRDRLRKLQQLSPRRLAQLQVVNAHLGFGLHEYINRPCTYFTILRHPVSRVLSMYSYLGKTRPGFQERLSLEEFVGTCPHFAHNNMTKYLSGVKLAIQLREPGLGEADCDRRHPITEDTLAIAKRNLVEHFTVAGLVENLPASLLLLQRLLGWELPCLQSNVSHSQSKLATLPPSTLALIEHHNQFDLQLYDFAQQRFQQQLADLGPDFAREVDQFHQANQRDRRQKLLYQLRSYYNRATHRLYKHLVRHYA